MDTRNETGVAAATRMDQRDWGLLVLLSILWGGSFFFNGVALRELPPLTGSSSAIDFGLGTFGRE
jgi:hypothetical protein